MKSFEQLAQAAYEEATRVYDSQTRLNKWDAWSKLSDRDQAIWIAVAQKLHEEISTVL